mgnify:CR=1 FL=1
MKRLLFFFLILSSNLFAEQGETILIIPHETICDFVDPYPYNILDIEREIAEFKAKLAKVLADKAAQERLLSRAKKPQ